MNHDTMIVPALTIGLDLGDKQSHVFALSSDGEIRFDGPVSMDRAELCDHFSALPKARVVMEVGTQSRWVSEALSELGHETVVANPRRAAAMLSAGKRKGDRQDAQGLAMIGRVSPELLSPIKHRSEEAQIDLSIIRARDGLVRTRTTLVNLARTLVKGTGCRLPRSSTEAFAKKVREFVPAELKSSVFPLLDQIQSITKEISEFDKKINKLCQTKYRETAYLMQVVGVGGLIALAFILTLTDPSRFRKSRDVGPFLGLVPQLRESGTISPQLRISKCGDHYLRRLLVGAAQYILGPFGPDTDLRRHGERIAQRGGKNAKKRAVTAVARKLAVLLHKLWVSREVYEPLRNSSRV